MEDISFFAQQNAVLFVNNTEKCLDFFKLRIIHPEALKGHVPWEWDSELSQLQCA
jgi:hypothetical protein